ncbi:MAG: DEAD/DEAH box helicase [Treponemataceae bacterium]|nr:DEAD/DEAH box helicase [Treponemataceae bacterium]
MEDSITFEDLGLDEKTLAAIARKGFETPSPIQALAIPRLLNGDANVIARARTGTGKTAAFGLPIVQELRESRDITQALVLEPTRELAMQTCTELQSFTEGGYPRTCVLYGGGSYNTQIRELKRGSEIVVGTPGRIQDHLERGTLDISKIKYFILDEGDEMLDMGFIDDIEHIFEQANPDARILLFSATMPAPILKIAAKFMGDYEIVEEEGVVEEPLLIDQKYWVVREGDKVEALVRLIDSSPDFYGLVFTQTKNDADTVSKRLDEKGYDVAALHGDIPQSQREKILARFRSRKTRVLVATDVAARGIDISGLSHVVNYSLPFDATTYVHRIGRTGRAGSSGFAVTFVCPNETRKLNFLKARVARASKGDLNEGEIPSVKNVIKVKQAALFDELKKSLGLKKEIEEDEVAENLNDSDLAESQDSELNEGAQIVSEDSPENQNAENAQAEITSEGENAISENADSLEKKSNLIRPDSMFVEMARELCENDEPEKVLAAVLSVMYGKKLSKKRYEDISKSAMPKSKDSARHERGGSFGGREFDDSDPNQKRLYIQLGRRDGYNAREIADYFSGILNIPEKLVDRIDVSTNFSLVSLPISDADRMLEMAGKDSSIPHIHVDAKPAGGGRGGRRGGFGGRDRDFDDDFGERRRGGRRGFGRERDFGRGRGFDRDRDFGRRSSRPNPHTPTERNGRSSFFKSKRSKEF